MCFLVATNAPNSDDTIGVTTEQCASISTPVETGAVYDLEFYKIKDQNQLKVDWKAP